MILRPFAGMSQTQVKHFVDMVDRIRGGVIRRMSSSAEEIISHLLAGNIDEASAPRLALEALSHEEISKIPDNVAELEHFLARV